MKLRFETHFQHDEYFEHKRIALINLKKQMELVCTFCPNYILTEPVDKIGNSHLVGVMLDIQIQGMHRLIEKYNKIHDCGVYKLTFTLNAYLSTIFEAIAYFGGDIIKFYGDKCLSLFRVVPDKELCDVLHEIVLCTNVIKQVLNNFDTGVQHKLSLKMCIASGNVYVSSYGTERKKLVFSGEPLEDIQVLSGLVKSSEVLISSKAWSHMIVERYHFTKTDTTIKLEEFPVQYKANERDLNKKFNAKEMEILEIIQKHLEFKKIMYTSRQINSSLSMANVVKTFVKQLPRREAIDIALKQGDFTSILTFITEKIQTNIEDHQPVEYLTQLTTITAQIIRISPISTKVMDHAFISWVFTTVSNSLKDSKATIYMFEVNTDVKIIVMSEVDGLRQDLESKRALQSGFEMSKCFQKLPSVDTISVGIFQGYILCGVLGHPFRRNYVALGSVLSRGFKILERNKGKVICDYKTFKFSKLPSFYFQCIRGRKCNLNYDTGQLMEYDESVETFNKQNHELVEDELFGRSKIQQAIQYLLQLSDLPSTRGIIFNGCYKSGRTTILNYIDTHISKSDTYISASVSLLKPTKTPYSAICNIYSQLYRSISQLYKDLEDILKLPSELIDRHHLAYDENREAMTRYQILTHFLNLVNICTDQRLVILIQNLHNIDDQSWKLFEQIMDKSKYLTFASIDFNLCNRFLKSKIPHNKYLEIINLKRLSDYWINTIACNLLGVAAIETTISALITMTCLGRPGYVESCLTYFMNCENLHVVYMDKADLPKNFSPIHTTIFENLADPITVMAASSNDTLDYPSGDRCTIASITKEFYFTLSTFDQLLLKTSSALGSLFSRDLLILALRSPNETLFQQSIQRMFRENIFECGSTFINGLPKSFKHHCCRCYLTPEEESKYANQKHYLYCKFFHFKHEDIRAIAYSVLPNNQKKDLHLLCTDILEQMSHFCPTCMRDPINSFLVALKYKEIIKYLSESRIPSRLAKTEKSDAIKTCIRNLIYNPCQCRQAENFCYFSPIRPLFDPTRCKCLDMLLYVFKEMLEHSYSAKHLGKQIFYGTAYGFLLILANDYNNGIALLKEAFEMCMVNAKTKTSQLSDSFRKFGVGRISMMMTCALVKLRKIKQAKSQMVVAFRQYNIPSVVFKYHHFQFLLKKSYLVTTGHPRVLIKKTWLRWEIGMCFILSARIFSIEGKLPLARNCAKYSAWILSQINERVPMLYESYCNVINLYRYGLQKNACEKMQKFVAREVLLNYCNDQGFYAKHLMTLLVIEFEFKMTGAELKKAICMVYRIIDITLKFFVYANNYDFITWFCVLFTYTLRFKQFMDLIKVIRKNIQEDSHIWYYTNALEIALCTGYSYIPIGSLLKELSAFLEFNKKSYKNWQKNYVLSLLYLHFTKTDASLNVDHFRPVCTIDSNNLRQPIVMRCFLNIIEGNIYDMLNNMQNNRSYTRIHTKVDRQLELVSSGIKYMPLFYPRVQCLKAWKYQLTGHPRKALKELRKAEKVSAEQGNLYYQCFIKKLKDYWGGNCILIKYKDRLSIPLDTIMYFTESQWTQVILPFPLM